MVERFTAPSAGPVQLLPTGRKGGEWVRYSDYAELEAQLAAKDEKIQALNDECQQSMLDIARERDRAERAEVDRDVWIDRCRAIVMAFDEQAKRAEAQLAEAKEELNVLRANQIAHVEVRARLTDQLAQARKVLDDIATLDNNSLHYGPEFARPAEQAVTEAMVEAAISIMFHKHGWFPPRQVVKDALKAAMEAGRHD